jgi:hypothetical protein
VAWDSSRPVAWQRLLKEWSIYASLMAVLFVLMFRDSSIVGVIIGLLASGPLYLAFGFVLAKFGYQRQTLREGRQAAQARRQQRAGAAPVVASRPKPPPTRRTGGGTPAKRRR